MGMIVCVAAHWVFSIPFMSWLSAPIVVTYWVAVMSLAIGRKPLSGIPNGVFRFQQYLKLIRAQGLLMMAYPSYQALFLLMKPEYRLSFISRLALLRTTMKNTIAFCGDHLEDHLPETVVFNVELFNAIYMAVCMQNLKMWWMALLMVSDLLLTALTLPHVYSRAAPVVGFLNRARQAQAEAGGELQTTLIEKIPDVLRQSDHLHTREMKQIRLYSGLPHHLLPSNQEILE